MTFPINEDLSFTDEDSFHSADLTSLTSRVPRELQDLENLDELIIHKTEGFCKLINKFEIMDNQNIIYLVVEDYGSRCSTCISKVCCRQEFRYQLKISDAAALCGPRENVMLVLRGCQRMFRCKKFQITLPDLLTKVGKIVDVTRWGFTTGYKVTFDKDLGVKRKAIILGACFLIVLICQFLNRQ
ncbi:uncharacterized protein LOC135123120 isoform X2 [Zophobas morio]|uniref:uncharacterized protein LOC135123120 isoform X2 n=1 Tax=Zophobas morio TaxID=2755281 RepID=UPI0030833136